MALPAGLDPGVESNRRLTALTGGLLFCLLAAIGVTILSIRRLLGAHEFVGFVLIPPVALKMGTTGYRFARYYLGEPRYRAAGPPELALRLLGPLVVASTAIVFGSGVELWAFGVRFGAWWITLHKLSFVAWFFLTAAHVLGHTERTSRVVWEEAVEAPPGRFTRAGTVAAVLLLGVVLALALLPYPSPFGLVGGEG